MSKPSHCTPTLPIRVLVVDDDLAVRDSYLQVLGGDRGLKTSDNLAETRRRLFGGGTDSAAKPQVAAFEVVTCGGAFEALAAVAAAQDSAQPFELVFLDMRMPPGPDGAWAAQKIRAMDPRLDIVIVIVTAYSDVDPAELEAQVTPHGNLFYLQKPFHGHEISQLAVALGRKRQAEDALRKIAYYDVVTGLPNRVFFQEHLNASIDVAARHGRKLAVLFIDLDNFKQVNDTLGHAAGDTLLNEIANRLAANVRAGDEVCKAKSAGQFGELARLGGDEFTVLLSEISQDTDPGIVAARLMASLAQPIDVASHAITVTASLGIAIYPEDGTDCDGLMKNADLAIYFAKRDGRNVFHYYRSSMNETALRRLTLENGLRRAIDRNELSLHYQPQIDLVSQRVRGMEALLRWNSPELGSIPPSDFIPIAEETGLILKIGDRVMRTACAQASLWQVPDRVPTRIAVNVSARQLMQMDFVDRVTEILAKNNLPADLLEIEITESVLMGDYEVALQVLKNLKARGVRLAIDDFGTGYSSLAYLKRFPVDHLKIDRSFIADLSNGSSGSSIAASIIGLAGSLGLQVTAEGVETAGQLEMLKIETCDEAQGFLFSQPMPTNAATDYLDSHPFDRT